MKYCHHEKQVFVKISLIKNLFDRKYLKIFVSIIFLNKF